VSVAWLAAAQCGGAQPNVLAPLKAQWDNTRALVEGIVALVPEDLYDFGPTPEVRSFREQFTHLIDENFRFMAQAAGEPPPMEKGAIEQMKGRDEIRAALKASYDYGAKVWARLTDQTAMEMIPGRHVYLTARAQASILIPGCRPEGLDASGRRPVTAASQGHPQAS
jgi:hypothetical protein